MNVESSVIKACRAFHTEEFGKVWIKVSEAIMKGTKIRDLDAFTRRVAKNCRSDERRSLLHQPVDTGDVQ